MTQKVLEAIPADRGDYRPDEVSKSALDLAWHLAWAEIMFLQGAASGAFDYSGNARPEEMRSSTEVAAWYEKQFEATFQKLTQLSGEQLVKPVDFRGVLQQAAVLFLQLAMYHSIHHRGQLTMYLRPMGAKVPSIYGESFDAREARMAQGS